MITNERVHELANKCASYEFFDYIKFSEMLIRECANVCTKQSLHFASVDCKASPAKAAGICGDEILKQFGVM